MLRGAAPVNGRAARPTVTRAGLVPVEEPEWSSRSPRAEIRVVDGIQEDSTNASKSEPTNDPLAEEWRRLFLDLHGRTPNTLAEDRVAIYRCPSAGRGLGETHVTVCPDWTGFPQPPPPPFWAGFRPCPEIAASTRVRKVDGGEATFPTSGFRLRQWCAVAREPRA